MIEVVFFDAGETLLRPEPSFPELAAKVLAERGHDVDPDAVIAGSRKVSHHFRRAADEGRVFSASVDESRAFWTAFYDDLLTELGIDDPAAPMELYRRFSDPGSYGVFDDTLPVLDALKERGYRLGVISNFESWLRELLSRLKIDGYFDVVAVSGDLGAEKPDPAIFTWALKEADADPSTCVHVGDQPYFDAAAAVESGLHAVLLDRYDRWSGEAADGGFPRIRSLAQLPVVLEAL